MATCGRKKTSKLQCPARGRSRDRIHAPLLCFSWLAPCAHTAHSLSFALVANQKAGGLPPSVKMILFAQGAKSSCNRSTTLSGGLARAIIILIFPRSVPVNWLLCEVGKQNLHFFRFCRVRSVGRSVRSVGRVLNRS